MYLNITEVPRDKVKLFHLSYHFISIKSGRTRYVLHNVLQKYQKGTKQFNAKNKINLAILACQPSIIFFVFCETSYVNTTVFFSECTLQGTM